MEVVEDVEVCRGMWRLIVGWEVNCGMWRCGGIKKSWGYGVVWRKWRKWR